MTDELPFYVERADHDDGRISYEVWQRNVPPYRNSRGFLLQHNEERIIATFGGPDFKRDAKQMADRVAMGLNMTTDMKEFG